MSSPLGAAKYNMAYAPMSQDVSHAANGAVTSLNANVAQLSTDNPALWLLIVSALTIGLIGFSTSVRVGPITASASSG